VMAPILVRDTVSCASPNGAAMGGPDG
jgi:hypothetical protein